MNLSPGKKLPERILKVRGLSKFYAVSRSRLGGKSTGVMRALDNVSFDLYRGETLGIVGESGSGKTTCARCILRAIDPNEGEIQFNHEDKTYDLARLTHKQLIPLRKQMQMIFQDPYSSLNPRMTVGDIISEPLVIHRIGDRHFRERKMLDMLHRVGLSPEQASRYPHAFSGGQRQRIGIARALVLNPSFVIADEAVSALDVCVRARVLQLLADLKTEMGLTMIFVSHDLSVIRHLCDRVLIMTRGKIVEAGDVKTIFDNPQHPYTRVLLSAIPHPDPDRKMQPISPDSLTPEQYQPLESVTSTLID